MTELIELLNTLTLPAAIALVGIVASGIWLFVQMMKHEDKNGE